MDNREGAAARGRGREVGAEGVSGAVQGALFAGGEAPDPALSQWDTPTHIAMAMARWARLSCAVVIEPSAGTGSLVRAAYAMNAASVVAVEIDGARAEQLRRWDDRPPAFFRLSVVQADWLDVDRVWSLIEPLVAAELHRAGGLGGDEVVIFANPPYDGGADTRHLRAMALVMERLRAEGIPSRLVVLARTVIVHGQERAREVWSRLAPVGGRWTTERVAFGGGGAGKIDVTAYECVLRDDPRRAELASRPDAWGWL